MSDLAARAKELLSGFDRQARLARAYSQTFETPDGEIVLRDLLSEGGILSTSHVSGSAEDTAFNEGKRALALHILSRLRWSETEMLALAREQTRETLQEIGEAV